MRIAGRELGKPNVELIFIPRSKIVTNEFGITEAIDDPIVLYAQAVTDMGELDKLVPEPAVPDKIVKSSRVPDYDNPAYKAKIAERNAARFNFLFLKSLQINKDLTWDTIKMDDSTTWSNYETELKEAGFNSAEIMMIVQGVLRANSLDESRIEEGRKRFLAMKQELN